jgi:hypothetical protein
MKKLTRYKALQSEVDARVEPSGGPGKPQYTSNIPGVNKEKGLRYFLTIVPGQQTTDPA